MFSQPRSRSSIPAAKSWRWWLPRAPCRPSCRDVSFLLVLVAPPDELEILAADLFDLGAAGVELQEPGQLLMPGTAPLPSGLGRCLAHFTDRETAVAAAAELPRFDAVPVEVPEEDWSVAWRAHHKPMRIGPRVLVHPPWTRQRPRARQFVSQSPRAWP